MRKPNPGMALKAAEEFPDVKLDCSLMIGDQPDRRFAQKLRDALSPVGVMPVPICGVLQFGGFSDRSGHI